MKLVKCALLIKYNGSFFTMKKKFFLSFIVNFTIRLQIEKIIFKYLLNNL